MTAGGQQDELSGIATHGGRFDRVLADLFPALSRVAAKRAILAGDAFLGEQAVFDPAVAVKPGAAIRLRLAPAVAAEPQAESIPLSILFEDEHLIVIDKPAGMVVHPAPGSRDGTLVNALIAHCGDSLSGIGGVRRPGIVHRLDKDTSGILVVAKHDQAHLGLAAQFAAHTAERAYLALVWGWPNPGEGAIEGNIGRDPKHRQKMAVLREGGRVALTRYQVRERFVWDSKPLASLVECRLATGRTHQIRVHLSHRGYPLIGDPVYGRARGSRRPHLPPSVADFPRQALHARLLGFNHPITQSWLVFESALPPDLLDLRNALRQDRVIPD